MIISDKMLHKVAKYFLDIYVCIKLFKILFKIFRPKSIASVKEFNRVLNTLTS